MWLGRSDGTSSSPATPVSLPHADDDASEAAPQRPARASRRRRLPSPSAR